MDIGAGKEKGGGSMDIGAGKEKDGGSMDIGAGKEKPVNGEDKRGGGGVEGGAGWEGKREEGRREGKRAVYVDIAEDRSISPWIGDIHTDPLPSPSPHASSRLLPGPPLPPKPVEISDHDAKEDSSAFDRLLQQEADPPAADVRQNGPSQLPITADTEGSESAELVFELELASDTGDQSQLPVAATDDGEGDNQRKCSTAGRQLWQEEEGEEGRGDRQGDGWEGSQEVEMKETQKEGQRQARQEQELKKGIEHLDEAQGAAATSMQPRVARQQAAGEGVEAMKPIQPLPSPRYVGIRVKVDVISSSEEELGGSTSLLGGSTSLLATTAATEAPPASVRTPTPPRTAPPLRPPPPPADDAVAEHSAVGNVSTTTSAISSTSPISTGGDAVRVEKPSLSSMQKVGELPHRRVRVERVGKWQHGSRRFDGDLRTRSPSVQAQVSRWWSAALLDRHDERLAYDEYAIFYQRVVYAFNRDHDPRTNLDVFQAKQVLDADWRDGSVDRQDFSDMVFELADSWVDDENDENTRILQPEEVSVGSTGFIFV
jgi:hypothetical protein